MSLWRDKITIHKSKKGAENRFHIAPEFIPVAREKTTAHDRGAE